LIKSQRCTRIARINTNSVKCPQTKHKPTFTCFFHETFKKDSKYKYKNVLAFPVLPISLFILSLKQNYLKRLMLLGIPENLREEDQRIKKDGVITLELQTCPFPLPEKHLNK